MVLRGSRASALASASRSASAARARSASLRCRSVTSSTASRITPPLSGVGRRAQTATRSALPTPGISHSRSSLWKPSFRSRTASSAIGSARVPRHHSSSHEGGARRPACGARVCSAPRTLRWWTRSPMFHSTRRAAPARPRRSPGVVARPLRGAERALQHVDIDDREDRAVDFSVDGHVRSDLEAIPARLPDPGLPVPAA